MNVYPLLGLGIYWLGRASAFSDGGDVVKFWLEISFSIVAIGLALLFQYFENKSKEAQQ